MMYAVGGGVLVLILILLWLNISWARQNRQVPDKADSAKDDATHRPPRHERGAHARRGTPPTGSASDSPFSSESQFDSQTQPAHAVPRDEAPDASVKVQDGGKPNAEMGSSQPERVEEAADHLEKSRETAAQPVEVLHQKEQSAPSVFNRSAYQLNGVSVSEFSEAPWTRSFDLLTQNDSVLGWIAFRGETVGASDQTYETEFLEVLRKHRQVTKSLQKHIGLSRISETTITGDEGKVWFLTAGEDYWFALFLDRTVNGNEIVKELLGSRGESLGGTREGNRLL